MTEPARTEAVHIDDLADPRVRPRDRGADGGGGPVRRRHRARGRADDGPGRRARPASTTSATTASASRSPCCWSRCAPRRRSARSDASPCRCSSTSCSRTACSSTRCCTDHPEIHDLEIERPIIIAGLPRTGTTHLQNLISADPALRSLPYWESIEPVPAPGDVTGPDGVDPRITRCDASLAVLTQALPYFPRMYDIGTRTPMRRSTSWPSTSRPCTSTRSPPCPPGATTT